MARTKRAVVQEPSQAQPTTTKPPQHDQPAKLDELREAIRSLSDADRAALFESSGVKVEREVTVTIYDGQQQSDNNHRPDEEKPYHPQAGDIDRPRALVISGPRSNVEPQEIDILASVRAHATNIGHPAILGAIRFWQGSVISRSNLSGAGSGEGAWLTKCGKIAKNHLETLGKALAQSAKDNAWSTKYARDVFREQTSRRITLYLHLVFEAYQECKSREPHTLITLVRDRLSKDEWNVDGAALRTALDPPALKCLEPGFQRVSEFLSSNVGKKAFKSRKEDHWRQLYELWSFGLSPRQLLRDRGSAAAETSKSRDMVDAFTVWPTGAEVVLSPERNWFTAAATDDAWNLPVVLIK